MSVTIDLPIDVEQRLRTYAFSRGLTLEEYFRELAEDDAAQAESLPRTPAGAVAYWDRVAARGVFARGPDAPELARQLRAREEFERETSLSNR